MKNPGKNSAVEAPAGNPASRDELTLESELADRLGLGRDALADFRADTLTPGRDFVRKKDGVAYTRAGLDAVLGWLGSEKPPLEKTRPVLLVVVRQVPNPTIVLARPPEAKNGQVLTLKVPTVLSGGKRINFFTQGALVPAVHVNGAIWRLHGAAPRGIAEVRQLAAKAGLIANPKDIPSHE